jgi:3-oxoacyl-[acyl-carrier protein] reductase
LGWASLIQKEQKVVNTYLITGAARGIGAALARRLAAPGRALWINYRKSERAAHTLCEELRHRGDWAREVQADVADRNAVRRMATQIRDEHGLLNCLIHNAAAPLTPKPVLKLDWEQDVLPQLQPTCHGFLVCLQELSPLFAPNARVIVLLTDALFHRPPVQLGAYLTAKGALWGLARAAAKELQHKDITFAFVSPGMTRTELLDAYGARALELFGLDHPLGRLANPDEIAASIAILTECPAYLHGANLFVNGGSEF